MKKWTDFGIYVICYVKKGNLVKGELYRSGMQPGVNTVKDVE